MLSRLSVRNIKKSFKDYSIYFMTIVLGVSFFYLFNAIKTQSIMIGEGEKQMVMLTLMDAMLSGVSVFVAIVLGCLIIYANNFLIRRRKKEFAIYLTLGADKRSMSMMLLLETFIIGIISLIVGLILGVFLSQFTSILVVRLFEANMSDYTFTVSVPAIIKSAICFGIIYFVVMIFNTVIIGKCKLIDLIQGDRKNEKMKFHNPVLCVIIFIISAVALARAYYDAAFHLENINSLFKLMLLFLKGGLGTLGVFWSLSGMILTVVRKAKGYYYKDLNSFVFRQFSSKINTMIISLTVICLMLFVTVVVLSSSLSLAFMKNNNIRSLLRADVSMIKSLDISDETAEQYLSNNGINTSDAFSEIVSGYCYEDKNFTKREMLEDKLSPTKLKTTGIDLDTSETLITISEYNKVMEIYGMPTFELADDEYIVSANYTDLIYARNESLKNGLEITINGKKLKPKYDECQDGFLMMSENHANYGNIIVPDNVVTDDMKTRSFLIANYGDNEALADETDTKLSQDDNIRKSGVAIVTKNSIKEGSKGLGVSMAFIGLYIGLIFLLTSSAVLALKELSESSDNMKRYTVLRRIGVDERMINRAFFRQIGMFFAFPMIIAIIHSIFGFKYLLNIMENAAIESISSSVIVTGIIIVCIYGGYFLLTYMAGKRIIKQP